MFHARDVQLTERLDYFCASLGIVTSFALQVIRALHVRRLLLRLSLLFAALSLYVVHISYLHFIHFDYGWNMLVSLCTGVLYSAFTCAVALREGRPYMRTILGCHLYLWTVALFEVFDFPPLWGLLDAHAVWHGATMWVGLAFWRVMIEDAKWEVERERGKGEKGWSRLKDIDDENVIEVAAPDNGNGKSE